MPESLIHWFKAYIYYPRDSLSMKQVPVDPCLLFNRSEESFKVIIGLQVNDILIAGTNQLLKQENEKAMDKRLVSISRCCCSS